MAILSPDIEQIQLAAGLFLPSGCVVELRVPNAEREGTISGYFSDPDKLARAVVAVNGKAPGIYCTLNPVEPALLARSSDRIKSRSKFTTADSDVVRRRWLLLDFDPVRPSGISSSWEEHDAAIECASSAADSLREEGWPEPVWADSGNGAHLLYRIDLPNDAESTDLLKAALKAAAGRYGNSAVDVDLTVYNAARISKVYGTVSRKGDSTPDRPHRVSRILAMPSELHPVPVEQLRALAAESPREAPRPPFRSPAAAEPFQLERWLSQHGVAIERGPITQGTAEKWVLVACPFNPQHKAPDAALFRQSSGRLGFKCLHASCAGKDWKEFREFYAPGETYQTFQQSPRPGPRPTSHPEPPSDACDENSARSAADVEAAADAVIEADDLVGAMRLAESVAALRPMDRAVIVAKLRQGFGRRFPSRDFQAAVADVASGNGGGATPPSDDADAESSEDGPNLLPYPLTDAGNGERIVVLFGRDIRWCIEMKRWLVWDGIRWQVDERNIMRQKAKEMARRLHVQSKGFSEAIGVHARNTESYAGISAALGSAQSEPGISISAAELDQHPYLLNCPNGVVNLRDGKLLQHDREFLITKLCPVPYNPEATCPRFMGFVQWAMGGNPEAELTDRTSRLVSFLQRAFGYSLTSDVSEKAVFVMYGERGNNGKTTLLTLFRELLGRDYSGQLVIDTVMSMKSSDATARADLADLRGVRLVVTSEVEKEHRLNEGKIKYITAGMGSIKSCRKYENPIEFLATHKLFMDCNHRPRVSGVDDAIWRRLKLIPFEVTVSEEDRDLSLPEKLRAEMPGVLAWAVRGCVEWMKTGLGDPPEVSRANEQWREHDDPLAEFLHDCCQVDPELWVRATDMSAAYEWWAKVNRERYPLGREAFSERLNAKKFEQSRSRRIDGKQARTWEGLALKTEVASSIAQKNSQPMWRREEQLV